MGPQENQDESRSGDEHQTGDRRDHGHSGEGAASALAHMISQGRERHPNSETPGG